NLEYILKDGGSEDGTLDIIRNYETELDEMNWVSEPDDGIYDAMNQGIDLSTGEYLFFLNSGDFFLDSNVVSDLVSEAEENRSDFVYGNVKTENGDVKFDGVTDKLDLVFGTICHQCILAHRRCFPESGFDTNYDWLADYDWVISCFERDDVKCSYVDRNVAFFEEENKTRYDDYELKVRRLRERRRVGTSRFRGVYKPLFLLNHYRLELKFKHLPRLKD
ncbi:MAG: glycosyltransferase, partial [Halobacteria archaeon]